MLYLIVNYLKHFVFDEYGTIFDENNISWLGFE